MRGNVGSVVSTVRMTVTVTVTVNVTVTVTVSLSVSVTTTVTVTTTLTVTMDVVTVVRVRESVIIFTVIHSVGEPDCKCCRITSSQCNTQCKWYFSETRCGCFGVVTVHAVCE